MIRLYGKPDNETIFVFDIIPTTRREWHKHYCFRCRGCGTFLRFKCDSNESNGKQMCSQMTHNRKEIPSYKTNREYAPGFIKIFMEKFKNGKEKECAQHFRH